MGEEVKGAAIVPESLLKKRKRNEEWALAKKEAEQDQKKKNSENRKLIFKRAEQYVKEYSDKEKELVQLKREAKLKGGFYVPPEAKLLFIIRIRGPANTNTKNLPTAKKLILMKTGGHIIYSGPLGQHSSRVIKYFEGVTGVQKIKNNYNPATWMLEVTLTSAEVELGVDFSHLYRESYLYKEHTELVTNLCSPPPGSKDLHFPTRFPQTGWAQFKACLWKQHLSYWRSPAYNLTRILHVTLSSLLFGLLFWKQGNKINSQQDLFTIFGFTFTATNFIGINHCSTVSPFVTTV